MKKSIGFLMIGFVCAIANAKEPTYRVHKALPAKIKFLTASRKLTDLEKMRFQTLASIAGLENVSDPKRLGYPVVFDLMASDSIFKKVIVLGALQVGPEFADSLYLDGKAIFAPVKIDGKPMSLLLVGFSIDEAQFVLRKFSSQYVALAPATGGRSPASETVMGDNTGHVDFERTGTPNHALAFTWALGESFAKCGLGMIEGFNAITWDPVKKAGLSLYNLTTNTRAWVDGSKKEIENLGKTIMNFDAFASKQWSDWKDKSPQEKSRFYCSFLGGGLGAKATAEVASTLATKAAMKTEAVAETAAAGAPTTTAAEEAAGFPSRSLYKNGKAPDALASTAKNVVEPSPMYIGESWWESPSGGAGQYPYLADRQSLNALKTMSENTIPDPAGLKDYSWKGAAQTLKDYPTGASERINQALKSPDVVVDGKSYALVNGERSSSIRAPVDTDFAPAPPVLRNGLTMQRIIDGDGGSRYASLSTPRYEYQGNGMTGYSKNMPEIQGSTVKIMYGDKMIEGKYLSSGGPDIPRGASISKLGRYARQRVRVHFVQVGNQTLMIPAEGAEIFAYQ